MKTLRIIALLMLPLFSALVIYGLVLPEELLISRHLTIEAPASVLWAQIRQENNRDQWQNDFRLEKGNNGESFHLKISALNIDQLVLLLTDDHAMLWRLQAIGDSLTATGHQVELVLKLAELPDGSTEAEFMAIEKINLLFSKVYLHLFRIRRWQNFLDRNLNNLQRSLG
jgi:hypothetical protein